MMKKLLVLSLVTAIASLASAGLVYTVGDGASTTGDLGTYDGSATVSAVLGAPSYSYKVAISWDSGITLDLSGVEFPNEIVVPGVGTFPIWNIGNGVVQGTETATSVTFSAGSTAEKLAGTGALNNAVFSGLGTVTFNDIGTDGSVTSTSTMNLVPEPMTMALLGLGGLFIRRRK